MKNKRLIALLVALAIIAIIVVACGVVFTLKKAEVYFVNTKQFIGQKWGTQNPIMMRDKDFGNVRLRGFGTYSFKVVDVKKFMEEVFGEI